MSTQAGGSRSRLAFASYLTAALCVGLLASLQSRVNGELATRLGNSTEAAVVSFATGLTALCVLVAVVPTMRAGLRRLPEVVRSGALPPWQLFGGLLGGLFVASQTFAVPVIGVALFTVSGVAGQTAASLYVDRVGLGPAGRQRVTVTRSVAAGLAVAAVVVSVSDKLGNATFSLVAVLLGLAGGAMLAVQGAINGRVAVSARSPLSAAWISFTVGTVLLATLLGVLTASGGPPVHGLVPEWWLYSGGLLGVAFVAVAAFVIAHLGVLLFGLCQIAGQVVGALVLDLVVPVPGEGVTTATYLGAALTLAAVGLGTGLLRRRP